MNSTPGTKKPTLLIDLLTAILLIVFCSCRNNDPILAQYVYDGEGKLIAQTSPDDKATQYNYNEQGLLTEIIYPKSRVQYGYDKNGNRIWMQDLTGTTEYYYDAFDRVIGVISKHSPWRLIAYDYDSWGYLRYMAILNLQMLEQELKYKEFLQTLQQDLTLRQQKWPEYEFKLTEMLNRLQQESTAAKQRWFEYEVKYNHDLAGNIKEIVTSSGPINYFTDAEKNQITRQLPNGITTTMTYSAERLLQSIRHEDKARQLIAEYRYGYNAAGKVVRVEEETLQGTRITGIEWDTRGYLKNLQLPNGQKQSFTHDAIGNRILEETATGSLQYDYDRFGRLLRAGDLECEWDQNGNLISQTEKQLQTRLQYDDRNLLNLAMTPQTTVQYNWDGDGNLLSRDAGTEFSHYLQDPLAPTGFTLAEYDRNNHLTSSYLYGDVLLGQRDKNGQMQYFLEDGFNSIRQMVDQSGKIIGQLDYSPFGEPTLMKDVTTSNFRMAGERFLPEIKIYSSFGGNLYSPQFGVVNQYNVIGTGLTEKELRELEPDYYAMIDALDDAPDIADINSFIRLLYFGTPGLILSHWIRQGAIATKFIDRTKASSLIDAFATRGETFFHDFINSHRGGRLITDQFLNLQKGEESANKLASYWGKGKNILNSYEKSYKSPPNIIEKRFNPQLFFTNLVKAFSKSFFYQELGKIIAGKKNNTRVAFSKKVDSQEKYSNTSNPTQLKPPNNKPPRRKREVLFPFNQYPFFPPRRDPPPPMISRDADDDGSSSGVDDGGDPPENGGGGGGFFDPFTSIERQIGGIKLSATAQFMGDIASITGAVYDLEKQCVVLLGERDISLPTMKPEDLAIALYSVFGSTQQDLAFSLDPADPKNPRGKWQKAVYIPANILAATSFGKAMFEADWLMKQYSFGVRVDENGKMHEQKSSVPGFKSTADLAFEAKGSAYGKESWARLWIVADDMDDDEEHNMTLKLASDGNAIYYDIAKMAIRSKKQVPDPTSLTGLRDVDTDEDPTASEFSRIFTELYDNLAEESPEFGYVRELAKAVALAKWLKKQEIPVDLNWIVEYANKRIPTVDRITALAVTKEKREQRPFSQGGRQGIETRVHQLHLFGGVDGKVNPKFVAGDEKTTRMQEVVKEKLRSKNPSPIFTVEHEGKSHNAVVLPITQKGQEMWKNSPAFEIDGSTYQFNERGELTRSVTHYGSEGGYGDGNGSGSGGNESDSSFSKRGSSDEPAHGHGHSHEDTTDYEYDAEHRLKKVKISTYAGWKIVGEKNGNSSMWTSTNPKGVAFQYAYDSLGQLTEFGVNGQRWAIYEIDQSQRKASVRYADRVEKISYDSNGNIITYEISNDNETEKLVLDRNQLGNLTKIEGTAMPTVNIAYDYSGTKPVSINTPQATMEFEYNSDESIKKITHSSGLSASYFYQDHKLTKMQISREDKQAEYWFDENGLKHSRDFLGGIIEYGYSQGKLTSVIQNQDSARYVYDERNRLREAHFPDGSWTEYQYQEEKPVQGRKTLSSAAQIITVITHPRLLLDDN